MPVWKTGDHQEKEPPPEKPADLVKSLEKGIAGFGKAVGNFFGGPEKKWQSKGEGHTLGSASAPEKRGCPPDRDPASSSKRPPAASQAPPTAPSKACGSSSAPLADKASLAAAAEARMAKLKEPKKRESLASRHASFGLASAPAPLVPVQAQLTPLAATDVELQPNAALLAQLTDMGFAPSESAHALVAAGNELEAAISLLAPARDASEGGASGSLPAGAGAHSLGEEAHEAIAELVDLAASNEPSSDRGGALALVHKLLSNAYAHPDEPKFRRVRLTNPKVQLALSAAPSALTVLKGVGFTHEEPAGEWLVLGSASGDDRLELALSALAVGLERLARTEASPSDARPEPAGPVPEDKNRAVYALAAGASAAHFELPESFYELEPAEAKALLLASSRKRTEELSLRTRAQRETAGAARKKFVRAVIRVRLPDGLLLQGTFGVHEPIGSLHEFVTSSLREQWREFQLTLPIGARDKSRSPQLDNMSETIGAAELAPASVLHLTFAEASADAQPPFLTQELMATVQTLDVL